MGNRILDSITSPDQLKLLDDEELAILADEIREEMIQTVSKTGGHLASSLGAVELILATHSLIDSPRDRFLFDVGHQSYAHMLVTGRLDQFPSLRQYGGLSGFPKPQTNPHDVHPSGHASDSLSVAAGLARARDMRGTDERIVTLIGDASIAGGMAFEALNDIGQTQTQMVIILNDNEMSISRNVGALAKHFGDARMSLQYRSFRDNTQEFMEAQMSPASKVMLRLGKNVKESLKQFILPESMLFEQMGIICTPPVDGHDIAQLRSILKSALAADVPVLVHAVTKKGAGYLPAEEQPSRFHGIGPFDIATGASPKRPDAPLTYTQAFTSALSYEMEQDQRIAAITAGMTDGTGLRSIADCHPTRVFDVGIAEGHAVGLASGMALGGAKPVVCLYSTFFQRAWDQTVIDVALADANVVFAIDRAGLVGDDGPTHHGMFDIALMRSVPGMTVFTPSDEAELAGALHTALQLGGPASVRYPRGSAQGVTLPETPETFTVGQSRTVRVAKGPQPDVAILAFGRMVAHAIEAAELLAQRGIDVQVVDMRFAKPLDQQAIEQAAHAKLMVTVEDGVLTGGAGEGVLQLMAEHGLHAPTITLGLPDSFVEQGKVELLFADLGIDATGICNQVLEAFKRPQND